MVPAPGTRHAARGTGFQMKHTLELRRVLERMVPGALSRDGFLGTDLRAIEDILDADRAAVAALGITPGELAAALRRIFERATQALGTPARLGARLVAVHREAMGRIPCPFGGCGVFPKGEVEFTDTATGESVLLTALGIHMVAAHGFCQGRGSRYRLDPAVLARLLGLGAE